LTGHLESPATGWFHTVFLPLSVPIIREEELLAALALPPTMIAPHGSQIAEEQAGDSSRSGHREEEPNGKKEEHLQAEFPKKIQHEEEGVSDRRFSSTFISTATEIDRFHSTPDEFAVNGRNSIW
jgi:hypothetical protein